MTGAGLPSRAYATDDSARLGPELRFAEATGRELDVAIKGAGWIAVQASDGTEAYTRAGDLHVDPNGALLTTATGNPVLGDSGPITCRRTPVDQHRRPTARCRSCRSGQPADDHLDRGPHQAG